VRLICSLMDMNKHTKTDLDDLLLGGNDMNAKTTHRLGKMRGENYQ
jgi:hypothetical protein